jgi:hypothetical protein
MFTICSGLYFFALPIPCSFHTSLAQITGTEFAGHSKSDREHWTIAINGGNCPHAGFEGTPTQGHHQIPIHGERIGRHLEGRGKMKESCGPVALKDWKCVKSPAQFAARGRRGRKKVHCGLSSLESAFESVLSMISNFEKHVML